VQPYRSKGGYGHGAGLGVGAGTVSKAGEFGAQAESAYPAYANKKYGRGHEQGGDPYAMALGKGTDSVYDKRRAGRGYGHGAGLGVGAGTVSKAGEFGAQAESAYPAYANKKYGRGHQQNGDPYGFTVTHNEDYYKKRGYKSKEYGHGAGLGVGAGVVSRTGAYGAQSESAYPAYANKKYGRGHSQGGDPYGFALGAGSQDNASYYKAPQRRSYSARNYNRSYDRLSGW
jgi:hypothetical protein